MGRETDWETTEAQEEENVVLCGSNSYNRKYYFNEMFANIPQEVQDELQILCVWFTEECGGILTMEFNERGNLLLRHTTSEYDGYHDEIGADLKIRQIRREREELLLSLELYYKTVALGMTLEEIEASNQEDEE
ncbi:MAG: DUF6145 family protein [Clostridiales bacterium]|nr:DUF6145 family protein [Clostridiales bacterium]